MPTPAPTVAPRAAWLVTGGAVVAAAVAFAASLSGAAGGGLGRVLGRLDGGLAVLVVIGAAVAQLGVTSRALDDTDPLDLRATTVRTVRRLVVPWWLVVTVATFWYPTAATTYVPSDGAAPTWVVVVRDWLLAGSLAPGGSRLAFGWVVTTVGAATLLAPLWERALRRLGGDPVRRAVTAGAALVAVGLVVRVGVAALDVTEWTFVLRTMPPAQLDLLGAGVVVGALAAGERYGDDSRPLARFLDARWLPVAVVLPALALLAGAASPDVGSVLDPGGAARTLVTRVVLLGVAAGLALLGLTRTPPTAWAPVLGTIRRAAWPALIAVPLAAQLWLLRAGGPLGSQKVGPLVVVTVLGAAAGGLVIGALQARLFGPAHDRRLPPFAARLAVITTGAFAWRLLTLVSINRTNPTGGDPFFYHHQANMLVDRVGYSEPFRWVNEGYAIPSAIHPPLMSTWLAVASAAGARTYLAHKAMSTVLGVLVVVVAALIARRLVGDRAGLVAAGLVAVYPNLWVIDGALWPEGIYSTMVGLAVLAAYRWWDRPDLRNAALLGTAIGLAALTRGEALFLYPLLVAPLVLVRRGVAWWPKVRTVAVVGLVGLVLFAPWTIRNQRAFGQFVILSTNGDEVLYYANCPESYGGPLLGYWSFNCQVAERARTGEPPGNEAEKARYWRGLGLEYARENADRIPVVVAARVLRELDLFRPGQNIVLLRIEGRPDGASRAGQWAWWGLAPVGVAGLVLLRRRGVLVWPLVSLGLTVLVSTVYAYGAIRFRTPLELALLIAAGAAVDHLLPRPRPPEDRVVPGTRRSEEMTA